MLKIRCLLSIAALYICCLLSYSCQPNVSIKTAQYAVNGQKLYQTHCQNCHGGKGEGLGKLYPPLTDKKFLEENRNRLACIVKNGSDEKLNILGQEYNTKMPAQDQLTDIDIAYILTYITTTFSDQIEAFTLEEIQNDLRNCK